MTKKNKVYCINCKYLESGYTLDCKFKKVFYDYPLEKGFYYHSIETRNKTNNCKDYVETNLFVRLARRF